jgi:tRNA threonylcarbamoyladenosine biosynthesis protein TsaE
MSLTVSLVAPSLAATHAVAATVAACCRPGDFVVLAGEMGAGKTAFAQGFGKAMGVEEPITSPTFTLVQSYATPRGQFHHADVYRLEQLHEVADLALGELAEFRGIVVVEWGDVVSAALGEHLEVRLELVGDPTGDEGTLTQADESRKITVTPSGRSWAQRWQTLTEHLDALDLGATAC